MKKLILAISVFLLFGSSFANAEQVYYCASELATGIVKDEKKGKWRTNKFVSIRWTIQFNDGYTKMDGLETGTMKCHTPYEFLVEGIIVCNHRHDFGPVFLLNKNNLRFSYASISAFGYIGVIIDSAIEPDTNRINAGTCQKF